MGPGGWGAGKKLKNVSFLGHFFLNFWKGMKKFDESGQIWSDWAHIENPDSGHRVLDSPGCFGQFFRKIRGKIKIEFFGGEKKSFRASPSLQPG